MTDRQTLLDLLTQYAVAHPEERAMADRIAALAGAHEDCFERTCRPGHLTGSAWVVSADRERHLLLHHGKLDKWLQPGGHADGQTDLATVARREVEEETGLRELELISDSHGLAPLDVDVHDIPERRDAAGNVKETAHEHHDVRYLFLVTGDETLTLSEESHELRWCRPDEVRTLTQEESVLRLLNKAKKRLEGPN
ncbi:NUDIX domain protein [Planctomycetes bacterium MalM25]|nr:NUDIX domain protein [Planctomycetes bacterium MalM25]